MSEFVLYACGCTQSGSGVYRYTLKDGVMTESVKADLDGAMFIALDKDCMYVPTRSYDEKDDNGTLYKISTEGGKLGKPEYISSSYGIVPCHNVVKDNRVYLVNYLSGNISCISTSGKEHTEVLHVGDSINKPRQDMAHTHQILPTPDGKYFTVCDLGMDLIYVYDKNLKEVSVCEAPLGQGPRHIAFSADGKTAYCVNELSCTVTVYDYNDGVLTKGVSVDTLYGKSRIERCTAAAIKLSPCGKRLYVSVRKCNIINLYELENGIPVYKKSFDSIGNSPRDFEISPDGKNLVCANEDGRLMLFDIDENGELSYTGKQYDLPGALCVMFENKR